MITILTIAILILSIIIHEISHGYMADRLGDPTARLQGRLTLNPLKHIDPVGSILVPLLTSLSGFTFGWAKPVPYNPYNLKNKRSGEFLIAIAGPLSNIVIALIFGIFIRFVMPVAYAGNVTATAFIGISSYIVLINIILAVFNLIPIPPLDGSKLLFSFFPHQYGRVRLMLETYSPILIFVVVFFLWKFISPTVGPVFRLFTGMDM